MVGLITTSEAFWLFFKNFSNMADSLNTLMIVIFLIRQVRNGYPFAKKVMEE